ncbi:sulfite exporter TauE/SafE family protein [Marinomonas gallaica]|uniref:sulfite exporter TauE/SafE family protein n=1 Tax=Marinomonas gallaica TaxID=1806667 RepID=UPI003CE56328
MISIFISALLIGLAGAGHCLGMCGGLASMLSIGNKTTFQTIVAYNLGRILSYCILTLILASAINLGFASIYSELMTPLRTFAGILLVLMGLYICGLSKFILRIESLGRYIWKYVQPFAKSFLPIQTLGQAVGAGMVWGWLPCGLVYSTVLWASSLGSIELSLMAMLGFSMGTLPAMLLAAMFSQQLKKVWSHYHLAWIFGVSLIGYGLYTIPSIKNLLSNIV